MNRLQTRVARIKQELETLLDDDQDMLVRVLCPAALHEPGPAASQHVHGGAAACELWVV